MNAVLFDIKCNCIDKKLSLGEILKNKIKVSLAEWTIDAKGAYVQV